MKTIIQSKVQPWQCLPKAFSDATGLDFDEIIKAIGHDGSAVVDPVEPEPHCREGFHIQELVEALWTLGWSVVEFDISISSEGRETSFRDISRFMDGKGVVTGYFNGEPHAQAWPCDLEGSLVMSFFAVSRRAECLGQ